MTFFSKDGQMPLTCTPLRSTGPSTLRHRPFCKKKIRINSEEFF